MRKIKPEDLKRHVIHETGDRGPEVFKVYAAIAAKAARADGVYGRREELEESAAIVELFARGFLEYDADGNVVVPGVRKLIPAVFVVS